jgi:hypothetical protein
MTSCVAARILCAVAVLAINPKTKGFSLFLTTIKEIKVYVPKSTQLKKRNF